MKTNTPFIPPSLRVYRQRNRQTQADIARLIRIDRTMYTYYELGRLRLPAVVADRLCDAWGVSLKDLLAPLPEDFHRERVRRSPLSRRS